MEVEQEGEPLPGGLSDRLWQEGQSEAFASLHHPFVQALAQNTLPRQGAVGQHWLLKKPGQGI